VRRPRDTFTVFFSPHVAQWQAAMLELPFERLTKLVLPVRKKNHRALYRDRWFTENHGQDSRRVSSARAALSRHPGSQSTGSSYGCSRTSCRATDGTSTDPRMWRGVVFACAPLVAIRSHL